MSILAVNSSLDFSSLKEYLNATDGNLANHLKMLEKAGLIHVEKAFINRKPNTKYGTTEKGKKAFNDHLDALEALIKSQR